MIVTLETAKQFLRVDSAEEDSLITLFIKAAEENILKYLNRASVPNGSFAAQAAACLMIADMYENREAQSVGESYSINPTVEKLLYPLRTDMGV